jgi:hydrogenase 3 maturation protease
MLEQELKKWLTNSGRIVIAGIGNPIRKDDFVGTKIVHDLAARVSDRVCLIECETVPESFLQDIVDFNPTHVLLIDAATMGIHPGQSRLITHEKLSDSGTISTHGLPLRVFCEYLAQTAKPKIALLLIQAESMDFGEGLTPQVKKSAKELTKAITNLLK